MNKISRSSKQYIIVLSANIFSMGLGFLINIIGTNIMLTETFGFYKAFITALQLFSSFTILGFHYTFGRQFAQVDTPEDKKKINTVAIIIVILLSIISMFLVFIISNIYSKFSGHGLPNYFLLAALFMYLIMFRSYVQQKLQGENEMGKYSLIGIFPQLFLALFFLYALYRGNMIETRTILMVYIIVNTADLFYFIAKTGITTKISGELKRIIQENKKHGLQLYFGSLFSVTVAQLLNLVVASIGGLEEYAFFSLGISMAAPMALIASTMGTIHFKKNVHTSNISKKEIFVTLSITGLSFVSYFVMLNNIMPIFIAEEYIKAIPYANILLIYYTMMGLGDYFNKFIGAKGQGKLLRNGAIVTGIVLVVFSFLLIPFYNVPGLIIAKLLSAFVYMFLMIYIYRRISVAKK